MALTEIGVLEFRQLTLKDQVCAYLYLLEQGAKVGDLYDRLTRNCIPLEVFLPILMDIRTCPQGKFYLDSSAVSALNHKRVSQNARPLRCTVSEGMRAISERQAKEVIREAAQ